MTIKRLNQISVFLLSLLLIPLFADDTPLLLKFAKEYYFREKYDLAESKIEQVLQIDPKEPTANIIKNLLQFREKEPDKLIEAKRQVEKYAKLLENDPFAFYALGKMEKLRNLSAQAKSYFEKALKMDGNYVPALVELGDVHFYEMLKYFYRVTDTEVPLSYHQYAMDDYDLAEAYLKQALELDPGNRKAIYVLCNLYYEAEDYKLMRTVLEHALKNEKGDKDYNLFMGLCLNAMHRYTEAEEYFETALNKISKVPIDSPLTEIL